MAIHTTKHSTASMSSRRLNLCRSMLMLQPARTRVFRGHWCLSRCRSYPGAAMRKEPKSELERGIFRGFLFGWHVAHYLLTGFVKTIPGSEYEAKLADALEWIASGKLSVLFTLEDVCEDAELSPDNLDDETKKSIAATLEMIRQRHIEDAKLVSGQLFPKHELPDL